MKKEMRIIWWIVSCIGFARDGIKIAGGMFVDSVFGGWPPFGERKD